MLWILINVLWNTNKRHSYTNRNNWNSRNNILALLFSQNLWNTNERHLNSTIHYCFGFSLREGDVMFVSLLSNWFARFLNRFFSFLTRLDGAFWLAAVVSILLSVSQSVSQSVSRSVGQSVSQSVDQPANRPVSLLTKQRELLILDKVVYQLCVIQGINASQVRPTHHCRKALAKLTRQTERKWNLTIPA